MSGRAVPPAMLSICQRMIEHLQAVLEVTDERPLFRLPPRGLNFVACIDDVPALAVNESARQLITSFVAIGRSHGPHHEPTVRMLDVVLEFCGVPAERVSLRELGIDGRLVTLVDPSERKGRPS